MKIFVEYYKCLECLCEFGISYAMFDKPVCPHCQENLEIQETTDDIKGSL